jgi:hypothetical protein
MTSDAIPFAQPDPSRVPLVIEEGWEPSLEAPLPTMRCVAVIDHDTMERCGRWSIRGLSECAAHAGYESFPSVGVYADAVVEAARLRLMGMADTALDALADLLGPDTRQNVRMRAVEVTLDRIGVVAPPAKQEIDITIRQENPAQVLAERLDKLGAATAIEAFEDAVLVEEVQEESRSS